MSKEEQIALELTRITGATTSGCQCTIDNYKRYLKELKEEKEESNLDATKLQKEIEQLMNKYNVDTITDTPDFILAEYLMSNLRIYLVTKSDTEKWFGKRITINGIEKIESEGDE